MPDVKAADSNFAISGRADMNTDPTRNFRFLVSFQPYSGGAHPFANLKFGFTSVSGLNASIEPIPYREGGMNTTLHQLPGQATFAPVTLTRGIHYGNNQAWQWLQRLFSAVGPTAHGQNVAPYPNFNFRSSVSIHVLQHPVSMLNDAAGAYKAVDQFSNNDPVAFSFRLYNAWITALAYSDLNAGDNATAVEQMTLVHEGFDMYWPQGTLASASAKRDTNADLWPPANILA
jgi:phage tail-like protein